MSRRVGNLSILYQALINSAERLVPRNVRLVWQSPAGPKTAFFCGSFGKWLLVGTGLADAFHRPAQNISLNQSSTLAANGLIWSRYSLAIKPKNYSLHAVNMAVFLTHAFLIIKNLSWRHAHYTATVRTGRSM